MITVWNRTFHIHRKEFLMDEKDFELLSVLKETRNISKAADQLFITQSALSKRIKAIEKEAGKELFIRSHQGVRFTPAGEKVLEHTAKVAAELAAMRQNLEAMKGGVCGTLNAGISINFSQYRLPDILASYHKHYPDVRLQITTGQSRHLYRQMVEGTLDVAVLRGEYPWDGFQFLFSQENICLVCNEEYASRPLSSYAYIGRQTDTTHAADLNRWMRENHVEPQNTGFCMDSVTSCLEIVKRGLGWALLPEIALEHFHGIKKPCIFANGEPFIRRTYIICQQDARKLPQVSAFIDELKNSRHWPNKL